MISSGSEARDQTRTFSSGASPWRSRPVPPTPPPPTQPRARVRRERALGDRRPVALVLEVLVQLAPVDHAARRGDVALLHRQHDVVVERLRPALDEQVVGGQAGAADPEAAAPDDVLDVVGDALLAL